jgi:putative ABC transport system permease protein
MLRNYINTALRNLFKHKFYSIINLSGLAVGIASFLMIYLFIDHELSFDRHFDDYDDIYRVGVHGKIGESQFDIAISNTSFGPTVAEEYPEVASFCRFRYFDDEIIKYGENSFKEHKTIFADSNFFDFWGQELVLGDPKTALTAPNSMVMTAEVANKYFKDEDPIGKTVKVAGMYDYTVTGIMEEIPENSHFDFQILMSMSSLEEASSNAWLNMSYFNYLKLTENASAASVESKFAQLVSKYVLPEVERFMGATAEDFSESGNDIRYSLEPLSEIYLKSDLADQVGVVGDIKYIYLFGVVAIFILLIACMNYMNLATARSANRAHEVGIRKSMGAHKSQLIKQFLAESVVMSVLATVLAYILAYFAFPIFRELSGKNIEVNILFDPLVLLLLLGVALIVGVISGSYPAFYLSSFNPICILQTRFTAKKDGISLRSTLVVFQFAISIFLMITTMVIYQQLQFMQNKKLGFDKEKIVLLENAFMLRNSTEAFREELMKYPVFESSLVSGFVPTSNNQISTAWWPGDDPNSKRTSTFQVFLSNSDFIPTYGLELIEGRNFNKDLASDSLAVILNEAAVRQFGLSEPVGQYISSYLLTTSEEELRPNRFKVIGVVRDFHFNNLKSKISPLVITNVDNNDIISLRIAGDKFTEGLKILEETWQKFAPGQPFEYRFLDQSIQAQYQSEEQVGKIMTAFSILTIFIASLGLFGLAAFTAEQRTKEIGIRKAMGATVGQIILLLSRDFLKLVAVAFLIASPVAYLLSKKWLADFEYHIDLNLWVFAGAGLLTVLIAWLTMSYQSIRVALMNPSNSLRTE